MNGKGDSPRNCFSKQFKNNYDDISWNNSKSTDSLSGSLKGNFKKFIILEEGNPFGFSLGVVDKGTSG